MKDIFRVKDKTSQLWAWGCFSLGLIIIFWFFGTGCSHNVPAIDATFWAGDSAKNGISRSQENKTIQCTDPSFDNYACLTYADVKKIYSTLLQCQSWGPALASENDYNRMVSQNHEVIQNVLQRGGAQSSLEPVRR